MSLPFDTYDEIIKQTPSIRRCGIVTESRGLLVESRGPQASLGELCRIEFGNGARVPAEVVGFRNNRLLLMPLGELGGIAPGMTVSATGKPYMVPVGSDMLGRVLDGFGNPIDGKGSFATDEVLPLTGEKINPLVRRRITEPLWTQVRAIDAVTTVGKGQRMGIFSGSGIGKSITLGMIARNVIADVNVIALVGERGREVREFLENDLGEEGHKRSVVVVVTSDLPAILRIQGVKVAVTISEYFRKHGKDVVLMLDSITRLAMAQREVGLSAGEPPTTKGYTPSVFALMPSILERAGTSDRGTITGFYTVLVEGDDVNEPVSDTVRSILDGHIVLTRKLANRGHYPAIDILQSLSRVQKDVVDANHLQMVRKLIEIYSTYIDSEDLINIGAYPTGSSKRIDRAIDRIDDINAFLMQEITERTSPGEMLKMLEKAVGSEK
ncbi:MAG: FliI/YscN family ATPase [Candidatus Latescibacteria bacterium]|nr:FliI/YscN family ATPase [Candidatus Latescibacterota bacterium]